MILQNYDQDEYINFVDKIIFGKERKFNITQPIKMEVGMMKFVIHRNNTGLNKLSPSYYLYMEKNNGGKILILYAKKMLFK